MKIAINNSYLGPKSNNKSSQPAFKMKFSRQSYVALSRMEIQNGIAEKTLNALRHLKSLDDSFILKQLKILPGNRIQTVITKLGGNSENNLVFSHTRIQKEHGRVLALEYFAQPEVYQKALNGEIIKQPKI